MGELEQGDHLRISETIRTVALDGILNQIRRAEHYGYTQTMAVFAAYAETLPDGDDWVEKPEQERICRTRRQ